MRRARGAPASVVTVGTALPPRVEGRLQGEAEVVVRGIEWEPTAKPPLPGNVEVRVLPLRQPNGAPPAAHLTTLPARC